MPALPRPRGDRLRTVLTRLPALAALLLAVAALNAACGVEAGPREPYANAFPTREAAARAVVEALAARDAERLAGLTVTEVEFRKNIWPHLPASRPEVGMPFEYLWAETSARNRGYLAELLHEYGGRRLEIREVAFGGDATDYGAFRIHPETRLTVVEEDGRSETLRLFGSMVEANGEWKLFSFVVD